MDESITKLDYTDKLNVVQYFQRHGLLDKKRKCPSCAYDGQHVTMTMSVRKDTADGYRWLKCNFTRKHFFRRFTNVVIIHWAIQSRQRDAAYLADCHRNSVGSFFQMLRFVVSVASAQTIYVYFTICFDIFRYINLAKMRDALQMHTS